MHISGAALSYDLRICLVWTERKLEKTELDFEQQVRQLENQCKQNMFNNMCLELYSVHSTHRESMVKLRYFETSKSFSTHFSGARLYKMQIAFKEKTVTGRRE